MCSHSWLPERGGATAAIGGVSRQLYTASEPFVTFNSLRSSVKPLWPIRSKLGCPCSASARLYILAADASTNAFTDDISEQNYYRYGARIQIRL